MEINILGNEMRVEIILLCILIGMFIALNVFCSCAGGIKEGYEVGKSIAGAVLDYTNKFSSFKIDTSTPPNPYKRLENNYVESNDPSLDEPMHIFSKNKMTPECCPSAYSGSSGCVCISPEQMKKLVQRG